MAGRSSAHGNMSPEQQAVCRSPHGPLVVGVVLYEMVTLNRPFTGATPQQILFEIVQKPTPARSAPADLQRIIGEGSGERYQSAARPCVISARAP
jgi:hypothetical protein